MITAFDRLARLVICELRLTPDFHAPRLGAFAAFAGATSATASPCGGADTKLLFLDGSIKHGWNIHATKLRQAMQANSRGRSRLCGAAGGAFFEKETS